MRVIDYIEYLIWEIIYSIVTIVYLVKLNMLNQKLLSINFDNEIALLKYADSTPVRYFILALILLVLGVVVAGRRWTYARDNALSIEKVVATILAILVIVILLIQIIVFINNPILRAVCIVLGFGTAIVYVMGK
jgi:hypothetical protein